MTLDASAFDLVICFGLLMCMLGVRRRRIDAIFKLRGEMIAVVQEVWRSIPHEHDWEYDCDLKPGRRRCKICGTEEYWVASEKKGERGQWLSAGTRLAG